MSSDFSEANVKQIIETVVSELSPAIDNMTLDFAVDIINAVCAEAEKIGVKAVVAVSNRGGNPVAVHCMDDSFIASYDIAFQKAFTVVSLKMSTTKLKTLAAPGGSLYGIQFTNQGKIVIFGGGEPLVYNGIVIGGLGVSGGTEEQDTYLAEFGEKYFKEAIGKK